MEQNENENRPEINEEGLSESNAAKLLRLKGEENVAPDYSDAAPKTFTEKLTNFWYHHKTKVLMTAFFVIAIGVAVGQFVGQSDPDVFVLYAGPDYITGNDNQNFCSALKNVIPEDYNDDGELKIRLTDIIFCTQNQMEEARAEVEARGEEFKFDIMSNQKTSEKFSYEIFGSEAIICILSEEQYTGVMLNEGFIPLKELFGDTPVKGAIDEYGIRFNETNFHEFYSGAKIFPEDAVLALRRVSTLSSITGRKKAEEVHAYHVEIFKNLVNFQFPEGYVSPAETTGSPSAE